MSMPTIESLRLEAESLGIKQEDITGFVLSQQNIYRQERAKEREHEKARRETELLRERGRQRNCGENGRKRSI